MVDEVLYTDKRTGIKLVRGSYNCLKLVIPERKNSDGRSMKGYEVGMMNDNETVQISDPEVKVFWGRSTARAFVSGEDVHELEYEKSKLGALKYAFRILSEQDGED